MNPLIESTGQGLSTDYENYSVVSNTYDETRVPIGLEVILGCLATSDLPLTEQTLLDAGCGTGNYIEALYKKVRTCYGIDIKEEMLRQARLKFAATPHVHLEHGSLLDLPYEDGVFDGVTCNQVIHHLDGPGNGGGFPKVAKVFAEFYRVLRPGGVVVLNTCSHQQLVDGYWWADLIRRAVEEMSARIPSIELTTTMLGSAGFHVAGVIVPLHEILQGPSYFDPKAPLNKSFREGDSTWSLISQQELHQALEQIRMMNEDGSINNYLTRREQRRKCVGQTTFIFARKY
ncbi:MAG: class I SAM-dependent methyltransferase [Candidatus Binatia bacterium]